MLIFILIFQYQHRIREGERSEHWKVRFLFTTWPIQVNLKLPFDDIPFKIYENIISWGQSFSKQEPQSRGHGKEVRAGKCSVSCSAQNDQFCPQVDDVRCIGRKHLLALEAVLVQYRYVQVVNSPKFQSPPLTDHLACKIHRLFVIIN